MFRALQAACQQLGENLRQCFGRNRQSAPVPQRHHASVSGAWSADEFTTVVEAPSPDEGVDSVTEHERPPVDINRIVRTLL